MEDFKAPYGRQVALEDIVHESGMRLLRIRIREGTRFTVMELDPGTAAHWGASMLKWSNDVTS
ncbi:MAG: hypothetical protein HOI19_06275 [Rhodospirillaceae bacterium]|nr:hypothetical protein [Rhodospirillaceae bacterium]